MSIQTRLKGKRSDTDCHNLRIKDRRHDNYQFLTIALNRQAFIRNQQ
jgi:hypothetical protein